MDGSNVLGRCCLGREVLAPWTVGVREAEREEREALVPQQEEVLQGGAAVRSGAEAPWCTGDIEGRWRHRGGACGIADSNM